MDPGVEGKLCAWGSGSHMGQPIIVQEPDQPVHVALPADDGKGEGEPGELGSANKSGKAV